MDYGCIVHGATSKSILATLDPLQHHRLPFALETFLISLVTSPYTKAQEMSLNNRRKKLSLNCGLKLNKAKVKAK